MTINQVFNTMGLNRIKHTCSVRRILIGTDRLFSPDELRAEINKRINDNPEAKIDGWGQPVKLHKLEDMGLYLYLGCKTKGIETTPKECTEYIDHLFVNDSMMGYAMELAALERTQVNNPDSRLSTDEEHNKYAIDIVVPDKFGVQVKPKSYKNRKNHQTEFNQQKNAQYPLPVWYAYYDKRGNFELELVKK